MKKKLIIVLSVLSLLVVLLLTAFSVWFYYFWETEERKAFLEKEVASILNRPVTIQKANLQIFPRLMMILNQVEIKERDEKSDFISLEKLHLGISFPHLFSRTIYFNYLILDHPRIMLSRKDKEDFNVSDLVGIFSLRKTRDPKKRRWLKEFRVSLKHVTIREGEIDFKDCAIAQTPVILKVVALNLQTGKISRAGLTPISLQGIVKGPTQETHLNLKGEVEPIIQGSKLAAVRFMGDTQVTGLSLSCFGPYFCAWKNIESLQGIINGSFSFQGIVGKNFTASGDLNISNFTFRLLELSKKKLTIDKAHLRFSLNRGEQGKWNFHSINLELPEFSATGKCSVDKLSGRTSLLKAEVEIKSLDYQNVLPKFPLFFLPSKVQGIMKENIKAGTIDTLVVRYSETLSPFSRDQKTKTIEGAFLLREFSFKMTDDIPHFEHLSGKVSFKDRGFTITNLTGVFGNSKITQSTCTISESGGLTLSGDFELDLLEMNTLLHLKQIPSGALKELEKLQSTKGKGLLSLKAYGSLSDLKNITLGGKITLVDADIDYQNFRKPAKKVSGTIQFSPDTITITEVTGLWAHSPFTCVGEIKKYRSNEDSKIYVHVESENADINDLASAFFPWKGVEGNGLVKIFIDFNCLGYRSQNLRFKGQSQFKDLTLMFPAFPYAFNQIEGEMGFSSGGLTFPRIKFQTGSSDISFSGLWKGLSKPKITGKLKGDWVNFLDFYKPQEKEEKPVNFSLEKIALNVKEGYYKKLMVGNLETEISSHKGIFYFSSPHATHGKLRDFSFVHLNTIQENQAKAATYDHGIVRIPFLKLESGEGYWIGKDISLPISVDQAEKFSLSSEIKNFSTEDFLKIFPDKCRQLIGILNLKGAVTGKGKNLSEWMETLNGELSFTSEKGMVEKLTILSKLFSLLNVSRIFSQDYSKLFTSGMPYDTLQSTFKVEDGIARTEGIFFNAPAMKMNGVGDIDLGKEIIDMEVAVEPLETVDKVVGKIPILGTVLKGEEGAVVVTYYKVTGTIDNPEWKSVVFGSLGRKGQSIFKQIFKLPETILNWNGKNNSPKNQTPEEKKE